MSAKTGIKSAIGAVSLPAVSIRFMQSAIQWVKPGLYTTSNVSLLSRRRYSAKHDFAVLSMLRIHRRQSWSVLTWKWLPSRYALRCGDAHAMERHSF